MAHYERDDEMAMAVERHQTTAERIAELMRRCMELEKELGAVSERLAERTNRIVRLEEELGIEREKRT